MVAGGVLNASAEVVPRDGAGLRDNLLTSLCGTVDHSASTAPARPSLRTGLKQCFDRRNIQDGSGTVGHRSIDIPRKIQERNHYWHNSDRPGERREIQRSYRVYVTETVERLHLYLLSHSFQCYEHHSSHNIDSERETVRRLYNSMAHTYDAIESELSYVNQYRSYERHLARHTSLPTGNILDLGCGTGIQTAYLARHARQVTGIDLSDQLLETAMEKCKHYTSPAT